MKTIVRAVQYKRLYFHSVSHRTSMVQCVRIIHNSGLIGQVVVGLRIYVNKSGMIQIALFIYCKLFKTFITFKKTGVNIDLYQGAFKIFKAPCLLREKRKLLVI